MKDRLIVALDEADFQSARTMVDRLGDSVETFKVGIQLFTACGPALLEWLREKGRRLFLDLKFHDIPATAARATREAARLGPFMIDVHASGGLEMMKACREAVASMEPRPLLLAVTVLTSLDETDLRALGVSLPLEEQALRLTDLALQAGLDGVIASPQETAAIRRRFGKACLIITPGVRPASLAGGPHQKAVTTAGKAIRTDSAEPFRPLASDQKRVATPREAIAAGADYLVVGRPIREAKDPREAVALILREMEEGFKPDPRPPAATPTLQQGSQPKGK